MNNTRPRIRSTRYSEPPQLYLDHEWNQAYKECMAYTDDLLRPLEEIINKLPERDVTWIEVWETIRGVLQKHKAGTGEGKA